MHSMLALTSPKLLFSRSRRTRSHDFDTTKPLKARLYYDDESAAELSEDDEEPSISEQDSDCEDIISERDGSNRGNRHDCNATPIKERTPSRREKLFKKRWRRVKAKKTLIEFKAKVEVALHGTFFRDDERHKGLITQNLKDITLWGVPLLPSKGHEGTDIILSKFLVAQNYKINEAMENLKETIIWRAEQGIDDIGNENVSDNSKELSKMVAMENVDKEGHPVCYNLYGAFRDREFYNRIFGTEESRMKFLRWRIQFMEESMKRLSFKPDGVHSFLFVTDMKNAPGPGNSVKELGPISKVAVSLFQRHYPELIYKHIIINAPFWYYLYHGVVSQYCTSGTRKKFVFARPHKVTETLLKYIPAQNIPYEYGGFKNENNEEFTSDDPVHEFSLRPGALSAFPLPVSEVNVTVVWEAIIIGWEVTYKEEFIPEDEGSYNILLHKEQKVGKSIRNSFYINEPGKIMIFVKNATYIKKKAFIRLKTKVTLPMYMHRRT